MSEAIVSIALHTLQNLLLEELKFLYGVSHQVKDLQKELKELKYLLEDVDKRQHESESIRNWIREVRHLSHRAEDVTETYAVQVCSERRGKFMRHLLARFPCISNVLSGSSLHRIGSEISGIKSDIARVTKNMQEHSKIRRTIEGETSDANSKDLNQQWKRQTYPVEIEDCFVGRENELKRLISFITDDKEHRVIAVWGMGGIGKTTIARKVYNHVAIKRRFQCFAWVSIPRKCIIRSVLEDVLKQLIQHKREDIPNMSNGELIQQLCQIQKAKRCMVVLDDLWEIDQWECLKNAFLVEGLNSKILLTTRIKNVANMVFAFKVGLLRIDDGVKLLMKKAFPHKNCTPDVIKLLQNIGKEMVVKCESLPLAISLLGGVLIKKKSIDEWELVNRNINTYLYRGEGLEKEKKLDGVLNLSYEDLPYYLKPCLLYMGQFGEDQIIYVGTLYRLWIAEGMISRDHGHGDNETLMDIAELYLNELVSRSIVHVEVEDFLKEQRYVSCRLHDVVRKLCLSKARKEDFGLQIIENDHSGNFSTLLDPKTRHLVIHCHEVQVELENDGFTATRDDSRTYVRSLQFLNVANKKKIEFPHNILDLHKFKLLRVLVIRRCNFKGRKLPRGIANLVHLKYLGLFYCALDELPSSISNLRYLYTLELLGSWDVRVPNVLKKMHRLKHLVLPYYRKENIGEYKLRLEGLEELEILYGFDSLVHDLKSVKKMKNLQYFEAIAHDNESVSSIINAITTNWKKLRFCKLVIEHGCEITPTKEGSMFLKKVFTCPDLHYLWIHVHVGKLIHECHNEIIASRIVRLQLMECEIEEDPMEILGKLSSLQQLFLSNRSYVGKNLKCHALGFPCLKNLVLKCLPNLKEWRVEKGAMPALSEIEISRCLRLKMVPYGLRFVATLKKLKITGMHKFGKRVLAPSNGAEGEDFYKVRHVTSIIVVD